MTQIAFEQLLISYDQNNKNKNGTLRKDKFKLKTRLKVCTKPSLIIGILISIILLCIVLIKTPENYHFPFSLIILGLLFCFIDGRIYSNQPARIEAKHFFEFICQQGISTRKQLEALYEIAKNYKPVHVDATLSFLKVLSFIIIYITIPAMFFVINYMVEQEKYSAEPTLMLSIFLNISLIVFSVAILFGFISILCKILFARKMIIAERLTDDIVNVLLFYPDDTYDQYLQKENYAV